jgi:hypothetical protein
MSCIYTPLLTLNSSQSFLVMIWFEAPRKDGTTISCTGHGWALCSMADTKVANWDIVEAGCECFHLHPAHAFEFVPIISCGVLV